MDNGDNANGVMNAFEPSLFREDISAFMKRLRVPVMKHIPKGARESVAHGLSTVLTDTCQNFDNPAFWRRLFAFTSCILAAPPKPEIGYGKVNLTARVKARVVAFLSMSKTIDALLSEGREPSRRLKGAPNKDKPDSEKRTATAISSKIQEGDVRGAARIAASGAGLAEFNTQTAEALRSLHPTGVSADSSPMPVEPVSVSFTARELQAAVDSFNSASSGGPDCMRPVHLKELLNYTSGAQGQLKDSLLELCGKICTDPMPMEVRPTFFGANLCALEKPQGGLRPIAVGNTFRRLVSKLAVARVRDDMCEALAPTQVGFGKARGAEASVHAVSLFVNHQLQNASEIDQPSSCLLKVDFRNAFNSVRRRHMLSCVAELMPKWHMLVWQAYGCSSDLHFGEFTVSSEVGVQQGDPLGPLLFCLAIKHITEQLSSAVNLWYLDDGVVAGSFSDVDKDLETIASAAAAIGLQLRPEKCELCILRRLDPVEEEMPEGLAAIPRTTPEELTLLGAPIGSLARDSVLRSKADQLERLCERARLVDAHEGLFLLRQCFAAPKILYVLRCAPCFELENHLAHYDSVVKSAAEAIANVSLDAEQWSQATLSASLGGLGLRCATDLALPAYLSSRHSCANMMRQMLSKTETLIVESDSWLAAASALWTSRTDEGAPSTAISNTTGLAPAHAQRAWDVPLQKKTQATLLANASTAADRARLLAISSPLASTWLQVLPISRFGLKLSDAELQVVLGLRLGARVCHRGTCQCGQTIDESGHHPLSCAKGQGRHIRHSLANSAIKEALCRANLPARLEPVGLARGDGKRPDGVTLLPWRCGRPLIWDFTCIDTVAKSHLRLSAHGAGRAAAAAEDAKRRKYDELATQYEFMPLAVETFGATGPVAREFLGRVGLLLAKETGRPAAGAELIQQIQICVQRGNAACVINALRSCV